MEGNKQGGTTKTPQQMQQEYEAELAKLRQYNNEFATMSSDDAKLRRQSKILKDLRMEDLEEGKKEAEKVFTPGVLGRLDDTKGDIQKIFDARRANLSGYTPQELQAMREEQGAEVKRNAQASQRELLRAQGRSGVYGATAAAQQASLQRGIQGQLADQERKLFLEQIAAKRQGLADFEKSATEKEQYNIGQKNKELQGKLTTQLGYAGLGTTERASVMGQILGEKQLQANLAANQGGKK